MAKARAVSCSRTLFVNAVRILFMNIVREQMFMNIVQVSPKYIYIYIYIYILYIYIFPIYIYIYINMGKGCQGPSGKLLSPMASAGVPRPWDSLGGIPWGDSLGGFPGGDPLGGTSWGDFGSRMMMLAPES